MGREGGSRVGKRGIVLESRATLAMTFDGAIAEAIKAGRSKPFPARCCSCCISSSLSSSFVLDGFILAMPPKAGGGGNDDGCSPLCAGLRERDRDRLRARP